MHSQYQDPMEVDSEYQDAQGTPEYQREKRAKEVAAQVRLFCVC